MPSVNANKCWCLIFYLLLWASIRDGGGTILLILLDSSASSLRSSYRLSPGPERDCCLPNILHCLVVWNKHDSALLISHNPLLLLILHRHYHVSFRDQPCVSFSRHWAMMPPWPALCGSQIQYSLPHRALLIFGFMKLSVFCFITDFVQPFRYFHEFYRLCVHLIGNESVNIKSTILVQMFLI